MKSITLTIALLAISCEAIKLQASTMWGGFSMPSLPTIEIPSIPALDVASLTALATDAASDAAGIDVTTLTDPDVLTALATE